MKKILVIILLFISIIGYSQNVYNPSVGTVSNKPYSPGVGFATDGRSMLYDPAYGLWRPYVNTSEVLSYLNLSKWRLGAYDIIVNTGGTLSAGIVTGGRNDIWYFKNGTADSNLVLKNAISTVNGQTGNVVTKNADSLKGRPIDTGSVARNGYYIVYDSTNKKFILIQPVAGYTAGTGIAIVSNVISAQNTVSLWNANSLRGRSVTTAAPSVGNSLVWDGTQIVWGAGSGGGGVLSGYITDDTLYIVTTGGSIPVSNVARRDYVDSLFSGVPGQTFFDVTFLGTGTAGNVIKGDTVNYYYTQTQARIQNAALTTRIDSIVTHFPSGGVSGGKTMIYSTSSIGDSLLVKVNDSLYRQKKFVSGANTTVVVSDSTISISATPGSAEINTDPFTLTATGNRSVPSGGRVIDYVEVNPTSDLTSFKMGTVSVDDAFIYATPCAGGKWTLIECWSYFPSSSTVYFTNITSSTQIKIHYQIQHE